MATSLLQAIRSGDEEGAAAILDRDPEAARTTDENGISALMTALYHRRFEMAEMVAAVRADLSFFEVCALGRTEVARRMLERDSALLEQPSVDGFTGLHLAAFFGRTELTRLLLDRGADVDRPAENPSRVTALHSAVAGRAPDVVEMLVASGADLEARQQGGHTPLMGAAANGQRWMVEFLLARGADPAVRNEAGKTAGDLAIEKGFGDLLRDGTGSRS